METIPHNFYYDPMRQGDGRNVWSWYTGDPFQSGGYLALLNGSGIMYYDCGKGSLSMTLSVPTDATVMDRQWGFKAGDDYVLFDVSGGTFQAKAASTRSSQTSSQAITWDSAWTGADTTFMIRWEAGIATFYVNGVKRAQLSDASIPYGPLSPYIFTDGNDLFYIKSVVGQGIHTLELNPVATAADALEPMGNVGDALTVTESVTRLVLSFVNVSETPSLTESVTLLTSSFISVVDTNTITEDVTSVTTIAGLDISDSLTITESVTITRTGPNDLTISVNDTLTNTESVTAQQFDAIISVSEALTVTDVVTDTQFA